MTTPRDAIGLSERLRADAIEISGWGAGNEAARVREAATQLDALQARVKELEAEIPQLLTEQRRKLCAEHDKDITELNRVRRVSKEAIEAAESRAIRAEQQRDEAYERAAKEADKKADDLLATAASLGACSGATKLAYTEADLHEQAGTVIRAFAVVIRRLAAGTEKEGK